MEKEEYVLQMNNIAKEYYGTRVLKGVDLCVKPGEIHALLGENGAGKSTLMNILFGMSVIHSTGGFEGDVLIDNEITHVKSPIEAMELGIGMVHQEFMLIPGYSITENIKLNREINKDNFINKFLGSKLKILDFKNMSKDARAALDTVGMDVDEWVRVAGLPVGYMQFIEIARELDKKNLKIIVFDEPTAVLTESEASGLLKAMKKIADSGIAILFITHRLEEVMEVADNITILRDGEVVAKVKKEDTNPLELAELMVGRKIDGILNNTTSSIQNKNTILSIKNLTVHMPGEEVKGANLDIKEGEILGIGGLAGQGKIGIANGVMGLYPASGEVYLKERELKLGDPKEALKNNLAFVSEDRRGTGLLLDSSIELNIVITAMHNQRKYIKNYGPFTQIKSKEIREYGLKMIKDLDIRCTGPTQITRRLSGGNQQKVCIARALTLEPTILFISEPTRGIDVGAKKLVLETLVKLNKELGMTIVMTSSELSELRSICNRIAIVTEGKIQGILKPDDSDANYGLMMAGNKLETLSKGVE